MTISNQDDIIDSRDIIERIEELTAMKDALAEANDTLGYEEVEELATLTKIADECEPYASDWSYGETLIRRSYWIDYVQELVSDCGYIPKDLPSWIAVDWSLTAKNVEVDYTTVDFDGVEYLIRSV